MTDHADPCVTEESCAICGEQASHKVEQTDSRNTGLFRVHPLTNYLCCTHFVAVMGRAAMDWLGCKPDLDIVKATRGEA